MWEQGARTLGIIDRYCRVVRWFAALWDCICRRHFLCSFSIYFIIIFFYYLLFRPQSVFGAKVQAVCCSWHLFGLFMCNPAPVITAAVETQKCQKHWTEGHFCLCESHLYKDHTQRFREYFSWLSEGCKITVNKKTLLVLAWCSVSKTPSDPLRRICFIWKNKDHALKIRFNRLKNQS